MNRVEQAPGPHRSAKAWGITALAVLGYGFLGRWPLPGVDHEGLGAAVGQGGSMLGAFNISATVIPILGITAGGLLVVRGGAALAQSFLKKKLPIRKLAFVFYLVLAAGGALSTSIFLETLNFDSYLTIVEFPGWAFRLMTIAIMTASAAALWVLATVVTRHGVGHGPLVIYGVATLLLAAAAGADAGNQLSLGMIAPVDVLSTLAWCVPAVIVGFVLYLSPAGSYPVELRPGLALRSPVDLLALVYAVPLDVGVTFSITPASGLLALLRPLLSIGLAIGLAIYWSRRFRAKRRSPVWLGVAIAAPLAVLVPFGVAILAEGDFTAFEPGPYAGDRYCRVTLTSEDGTGVDDADRIRQRLNELDVPNAIDSAEPGRIVLLLEEVSDCQTPLRQVVSRRRLELRFAAEMPPDLSSDPDVHFIDSSPSLFVSHYEAVDVETLSAALAGFTPPPGHRIGYQCEDEPSDFRDSVGAMCKALLLEAPSITSADIRDAFVSLDAQTQRPVVSATLTEGGARAFGDATGANVGRFLAIAVDDEILSVPRVQDRIDGGRVQITLGAYQDYEALHREADGLAAALRHGALAGAWQVDYVSEITR